MKFLITGSAGFIGFHLTRKLLLKKHQVVGLDNLNEYYNFNLKKNRIKNLKKISPKKNFIFIKVDLNNK